MSRFGFCCNWIPPNGDATEERSLNQTTTTLAALERKSPRDRTEAVISLVRHNLSSLLSLVEKVGSGAEECRMMRLGSNILPAFTHELTSSIYRTKALREIIETGFARIGDEVKRTGIRLSFHPGQFCVLNNDDPLTLRNTVAELEYHTKMANMMGFSGWHDRGMAINIHTGGRAGGTHGFIQGLKSLSSECRNFLTVENDEFSFGLDAMEDLAPHVAIVLDIHHEWVFSNGEYVQADDPRLEYVKDSWRGVRPLGHYALSAEKHLPKHPEDVLPDFSSLVRSGVTKRDLRAHSDGCWNTACNDWALSHSKWMDIEVEAKDKNLAVETLYSQFLKNKNKTF